MQIGIIGLGKMGLNMAKRLLADNHEVVGLDHHAENRAALVQAGGRATETLDQLVAALTLPRSLWLMIPAGVPTEETLTALQGRLGRGDLIIEGGNTFYRDSMRRAETFATLGIDYLDAGTSGGIWGLKVGYCLMVGGSESAFRRAEPLFATLAPPDGYRHVGPSGAGHFTKMVHNGIEYGLLQAYAEGFELLNEAPFPLDLPALAHLWNQGSVVRSWLLELAEDALANPGFSAIRDYVEDSGEGRWTVTEAIERNVPVPVITLALQARLRSRQESSYASRFIAALRQEFGGHKVQTS